MSNRSDDRPPRYRTYLLTIWEERGQEVGAERVWRFGIEDSQIKHRHVFVTLEQMMAYIQDELVRKEGNKTNPE